MVQSPSWEVNWFAASQEIPHISRNPKIHYCTHKRPSPVSILGQLNPVHIPTSQLLEIRPNITHPSMPMSPQWSLSLWFPHQDPIHPLSSLIPATCPAHLIILDFITRTILGEGYKSFSSSLCNLLHSPITSSLLGPNILLNTMFSNTLSLVTALHYSICTLCFTQQTGFKTRHRPQHTAATSVCLMLNPFLIPQSLTIKFPWVSDVFRNSQLLTNLSLNNYTANLKHSGTNMFKKRLMWHQLLTLTAYSTRVTLWTHSLHTE